MEITSEQFDEIKKKMAHLEYDEIKELKEQIQGIKEDMVRNNMLLEQSIATSSKLSDTLSTVQEAMIKLTSNMQYNNEATVNLSNKVTNLEIKKLDLPTANKEAVYNRMISERNNIAASYKAQGEQKAQEIKNDTDEEVKNAYYNWIDSIMDGRSFLTKQVVEIFESTVQAFSTSKVVRLKLIEIATVHSYRDANWAINIYNKDCKKPGTFIGVEQKQNVGIDPNSVF